MTWSTPRSWDTRKITTTDCWNVSTWTNLINIPKWVMDNWTQHSDKIFNIPPTFTVKKKKNTLTPNYSWSTRQEHPCLLTPLSKCLRWKEGAHCHLPVRNWAFSRCPDHTQSWCSHLLPVSFFTCRTFRWQSGVPQQSVLCCPSLPVTPKFGAETTIKLMRYNVAKIVFVLFSFEINQKLVFKKNDHVQFYECFTERSKSGPTHIALPSHLPITTFFKALYMTSAAQSPCLNY